MQPLPWIYMLIPYIIVLQIPKVQTCFYNTNRIDAYCNISVRFGVYSTYEILLIFKCMPLLVAIFMPESIVSIVSYTFFCWNCSLATTFTMYEYSLWFCCLITQNFIKHYQGNDYGITTFAYKGVLLLIFRLKQSEMLISRRCLHESS